MLTPNVSISSRRLAGWACLASPLLLLAGLGPFKEDISEMLLIAAPVLLAPAMCALGAARGIRWMGLLGVGAVGLLLLLQGLTEIGFGVPDAVFTTLVALTGAMSVWLIVASLRGPAWYGLPIGAATLGFVAGTSWLGLLTGSFLSGELTGSTAGVWSLLAPLWILSYVTHTVWLGGWLLMDGPSRVRLREG